MRFGTIAVLVSLAVGCKLGPTYEGPPPIVEDPSPGTICSELEAVGDCSDDELRTALVTLSWKLPRRLGTELRVDISAFRGGFERGEFESLSELSNDAVSVVWKDGSGGVNYYWRVLTLTRHGWTPSATGRFLTPVCPADMQEGGDGPR